MAARTCFLAVAAALVSACAPVDATDEALSATTGKLYGPDCTETFSYQEADPAAGLVIDWSTAAARVEDADDALVLAVDLPVLDFGTALCDQTLTQADLAAAQLYSLAEDTGSASSTTVDASGWEGMTLLAELRTEEGDIVAWAVAEMQDGGAEAVEVE
jgi:hypothetical protein